MSKRLGALTLLVIGLAGAAHGQFEGQPILSPDVTVEEIDQVALSQLQRADKFFAEQQHSDGLETLLRAVEHESQRLVPVMGKSLPKGFTTYVPLRDEGQRRLCAMAITAPEALRLYRSQVDAEARTLFETARKERDEELLRRIVESYLASSIGDDAAMLLGDAALSRGDVAGARRAWLKLHPSLRTSDTAASELGIYPGLPWFLALRGREQSSFMPPLLEWLTRPSADSLLAAHPDSDIPLAEMRARLVVASILEGNRQRAQWELGVFRDLHAGQQGKLAGRTGEYVELLRQMLEQSRTWESLPIGDDWPTFGGSPERSHIAADDVDVAGEPLWEVELPPLKGDRDLIGAGRLRVAENPDEALSYHPIVIGNLAIVADGRSLRAFNVDSGAPAWEVLLRESPTIDLITNRQVGLPRFTVSAAAGLAMIAFPAPVLPAARAPTIRRDDLSRLVAVDLVTRKLVFEVVADDATMVFAGTPIIDRGHVFVAVRKQAEIRPRAMAACYDLASGRRLWLQDVCSAESLGQGNLAEFASSLLTLSHGTLYYNTNLGAVAALSADDGAIRWLVKYPRATFPAQKPERSDRHFFRDLNPCVVHQGQVLCAPADCDRIFSLDAASGQLVWTLPPGDVVDVVHLLGVKENYLLASGDYLYWIDVVTGQVATQFPQALPIGPGLALPSPRGMGRGTLTGDNVYFPTESSIEVFAQRPEKSGMFYVPKRVEQIDLSLRNAQGGNIVVAGKHLLLASGAQLFCFGEHPPNEKPANDER